MKVKLNLNTAWVHQGRRGRSGTDPVQPVTPVPTVENNKPGPAELVVEVVFDNAASDKPKVPVKNSGTPQVEGRIYKPDGKGGIRFVTVGASVSQSKFPFKV